MTAFAGNAQTLERKDESGTDKAVIEEITREIKGFGDNVKELRDSMERDLEAVRKIAEEAKGAASAPEVKSQIEALTASVAEKHSAIEKTVSDIKEQADRVETAMNRHPTGGDQGGVDGVKQAIAFFEAKAAVSGNLDWRNRPNAENIDLDGYKLWDAKFGHYLRARDERQVEEKALSVGSNPDGGYLVPTATSARIIERIYETSPLRGLATIETIGTESLKLPIDVDEITDGWEGETEQTAEAQTPQLGEQTIATHTQRARPRVTQQLLDDASVNIEQWLARKVGDRMGRTEASAFITGTGVNRPRGILTYAAGTDGARGTVAQYNSGAATALTADAIVAMPFRVKGAYLANARWLMKRSTVMAVMLLKDGQGQYLWRPALTEGQPSVLGGYPVQQADDMPAVAAGSLSLAFGDFRRGYTIVDRQGITTLRDPYSAKPFVEFYTRKRVGGDVTDFEAFALMKIAA